MKKVLILVLLAFMVAGGVFAQVADGLSIGAWTRGMFAPLYFTTDEDNDGNKREGTGLSYVGTGVTHAPGVVSELVITGGTEHIGFGLGLEFAGAGFDPESSPVGAFLQIPGFGYFGFNGGTGAHVWAKPFGNDVLKITAGRYRDSTLRGKLGEVNDAWEYFVLSNWTTDEDRFYGFLDSEEDGIFTAFKNSQGFLLSSNFGVDGLFFGVNVPSVNFTDWVRTTQYRFIEIGAGYEIAEKAHIRLGFFGGWATDNGSAWKAEADRLGKQGETLGQTNNAFVVDHEKPARLEAAFALTAVEGLTLDLGLKFFFPTKIDRPDLKYKVTVAGTTTEETLYSREGPTHSKGVSVALGAAFETGPFNLNARVESTFGGYKEADGVGKVGSAIGTVEGLKGADNRDVDAFTFGFRLVPSFDVGFARIGLDIGMAAAGKSNEISGGTNTTHDDDSINFGAGAFIQKDLGIGFIKAGFAYQFPPSYNGKTIGQGIFSIPVMIEMGF